MKNSNFREIAYFQTLKTDVKIGPFPLIIVGIGGLEIEEQNKHENFCIFKNLILDFLNEAVSFWISVNRAGFYLSKNLTM